jgi:hypothetical protein
VKRTDQCRSVSEVDVARSLLFSVDAFARADMFSLPMEHSQSAPSRRQHVRCQGTADITTGIEQGCATELRADTSVELALPRCGPQVPWVS